MFVSAETPFYEILDSSDKSWTQIVTIVIFIRNNYHTALLYMCIWCNVTQRDSVTLSSKYSNNISARINSDPTFDMNLATLGCVSRLRLWVFVSPSTPTVYVTAAARSIVVFNIPLNWVYAVSPTWYFTFRRLHSTIDYFRHIEINICLICLDINTYWQI